MMLDKDGVTALELTPSAKIEQEIREKGFIADKDCENCWDRGWVKRKTGKDDEFMWDYCGCVHKDPLFVKIFDQRRKTAEEYKKKQETK
jgi:hypothetical protein